MNWREQVEAQIARLKNGDFSDMCEIEDTMQALKDVAVAAEWIVQMQRNYREGRQTTLPINDYTSGYLDGLSTASRVAVDALDKLREVGDE